MARRNKTPWHDDFRARLRFEHGAREQYPGLRARKFGGGAGAEVIYSLQVEVPYYDAKQVEISFLNGRFPGIPKITADGPKDSPHRYRDNALCIWEPKDRPERRWVSDDGLLALIEHIRQHLFREAWWREHGEWLGPEVVHWSEKDAA
jgi:hypothetical protein